MIDKIPNTDKNFNHFAIDKIANSVSSSIYNSNSDINFYPSPETIAITITPIIITM